jgi:hypothetical protein
MRIRFEKEQPIRLTKEGTIGEFIESYQFLHYLGKQKSTIAAPEKRRKRSGWRETHENIRGHKKGNTYFDPQQTIHSADECVKVERYVWQLKFRFQNTNLSDENESCIWMP